MGYIHNFFAVDLEKFSSIYGSKDRELLASILQEQAEEIEDNDGFFEEEIEDGEMPDTTASITQIFDGAIQTDVEGAMYGYALQMIADHMGERVEGGEYGVAAVRDQPFHSLLAESGPPVPIPIPSDFPEIGFLSLDQLPEEIARARNYQDNLGDNSTLTPYQLRMAKSEEVIEDLHAYIETLEQAQKLGLGVVSFRH